MEKIVDFQIKNMNKKGGTMEIILASNNKNKLKEITNILKPFDIKVISQESTGFDIDVEETGTTFAENAVLKAEAIYHLSKKPVISDDSGLEIDYLHGEPGIYSKRYAGANATNQDRINKILNLMENAKEEERTARFVCAVCYIDEKGEKHIFQETCEGTILKEPRGENGFGYDPIFLYKDRTFAQMNGQEKDKVSHRGKALRRMAEYFKGENKN